jgi:type IV secretion system protein TrbJ
MSLLRRVMAAGAIAVVLAGNPKPTSAQWIVFDPNNYAQNVLTAARALQQINNQITSLQNQAQMLINQGKNLATLPFSSLLQLEQSILRTQQLLGQAQRIAYDIQQIDRAFSTTYAPASSGSSDQALVVNAQARWQNAIAGLQDAMRLQATVVGNLDTNRTQMSALVTASQGATGVLQANQAVTSSSDCRPSSSPISPPSLPHRDELRAWSPRSAPSHKTRAGNNSVAS